MSTRMIGRGGYGGGAAAVAGGVAAARLWRVRRRPRLVKSVSVTPAARHRVVTLQNMNQNMVRIEYAVRGPLVIRATEIEKELKEGKSKPFKKVIKANIGDAHAMGQTPITFIRQVLSCVALPELIPECSFPDDVKLRANEILDNCGGRSVGAYSASQGIDYIRKHVAEFICRRDGYPSDYTNIVLSTGASTVIKNVLELFCHDVCGKKSAVMVPIPQYPLYSAALAQYDLGLVGYYLKEEERWGMDLAELQRALEEAAKKYCVRAITVINPGNPTGQVLTRQHIIEVVKFAQKNNLFILADEVYQDNVYEGEFISFKKVTQELGPPYSEMELVSFMSASKGYMGECGLRGGWAEIVNMDPEVQTQLYKTISAMLCPTTLGQTAIDCVVTLPVILNNVPQGTHIHKREISDPYHILYGEARHPFPGEPSYRQWLLESCEVLGALKDRAKLIASVFNKMEGFSCQPVMGAMYAFPQIKIPPKAMEAAQKAKLPADVFYAFRLLEETGICVVPGSGFGQKKDTWHFRTTILPQTPLLTEMLDTFQKFQQKFMKEYS